MASKKYLKPKLYRLIDQQIALKQEYSEATCSIQRGILYWSGYLCPTPMSRTYHVTLEYKVKKRPRVTLIGENLQGLDKSSFPHKFHIDQQKKQVDICLHLGHEFGENMLIADTIVPWAIEWLYYYEIWLTTDEWCGGGKCPVVEGKKARVQNDCSLETAV